MGTVLDGTGRGYIGLSPSIYPAFHFCSDMSVMDGHPMTVPFSGSQEDCVCDIRQGVRYIIGRGGQPNAVSRQSR